ncbi:MAG: hypothetical protein NTX46_03330 [Chloroflexi bacterium]|nr:hypothetical protein [Chloroflexota bacterium]
MSNKGTILVLSALTLKTCLVYFSIGEYTFCKVGDIMGLILGKGVCGVIIKCPRCGTKNSLEGELVPDTIYRCASCNSIIAPQNKVEIVFDTSGQVKIQTKYYALRIIVNTLQILAFIVGIGGIIASILGAILVYNGSKLFSIAETLGPILFMIVGVFFSVVAFIIILAYAETIKVFIDIEANTRATELNTRHKNT